MTIIEAAPQNLDNQIPEAFAKFDSQVYVVAISNNGRRMAIGLKNGMIEIWDLLIRDRWVSCKGHTGFITSVAFSPDGQTLVSGSEDKTVRLWNVQSGEMIGYPLIKHTGFVSSVAFSPDGQTIVSGSQDKTIQFWNIQAKPIGECLTGHMSAVRSVAFSPDGKSLVSGSFDHTIQLWDIQSQQPIGQPLIGHTDIVISVVFSPDGQSFISGSFDKALRLWDIQGQSLGEPFTGHTDFISSVAFSHDGKTIVSGSFDKTVRLWDMQGESIGQPFIGHTDVVSSVALSQDGKTLVSGSFDQTVRLWNLQGQSKSLPFTGHTDSVRSIALSPDGQTLVSGSDDKTLRLWNLQGEPLGQPLIGHTGSIFSVALSHDGQTIVSGSQDETLRLWNIQGKSLGQPLIGHTDSVKSVVFSADDEIIASGSSDYTVRLWNIDGEPLGQSLIGHTGFVFSVALSDDGQTLVSSSDDHTIRLWDIPSGKIKGKPLIEHQGSVTSVVLSDDGRTLVSGSYDDTVRLWDIQGKPLGQPFAGHTSSVISVALSQDGKTLVSGSDDSTVRLWDLSDPQHRRHIIIGKHDGIVYSVAFHPHGDYIFSSGEDGIKVWRWQKFNVLSIPQAFCNDQPIGEDYLDIAKEIQSLADILILRNFEPPLVVGILGNWGSGKSFAMHLIQQHITKNRCQKLTEYQTWGDEKNPHLSPYVGHIYQINFDAWSYAKSDIWSSLVYTIFSELNRQLILEKQLQSVGISSLDGGDIWCVLNEINHGDIKNILQSILSPDVFDKWQKNNSDIDYLWEILSELRKYEKEKLAATQNKIKELRNQKYRLEENWQERKIEIKKEINTDIENRTTLILILKMLVNQKHNFWIKDILTNLEIKIPDLTFLKDLTDEQLIEIVESKDDRINFLIKNLEKLKVYPKSTQINY